MKSFYQNKYRVESARLKSWNYTTPWWYYVTICTKNKFRWFGDIKNGKMHLNEIGEIANTVWQNIPLHFLFVELDYFTIMPNHLHGVLILNEQHRRDVACNVSIAACNVSTAACNVSTNKNVNKAFSNISPKKNSLSVIIRSFKSAVTKLAHENNYSSFAWQPRFYDHIIRNENDLFRIRKYIELNPLKWEMDKYYINI